MKKPLFRRLVEEALPNQELLRRRVAVEVLVGLLMLGREAGRGVKLLMDVEGRWYMSMAFLGVL